MPAGQGPRAQIRGRGGPKWAGADLASVVLQLGCRTWDMLAYMKRTTIKLPDEVDARLRHEAQRRNLTISQLTREAIESHLGVRAGRRRLGAAGAGRSGRDDVSERIEEILATEVGSSSS